MCTARTFASTASALALAAGLGLGTGAGVVLAQHEDRTAGHDDHAAASEGAGHGDGHEAHGDGHEAHAPQWNYVQFAGQLTNFAIWLFLLYTILNRALPKFLAERRAAVVDGLEEAKRMKAEAEAKYEAYSKRIDTMDEELARVREEMKKAGLAERDRLVKEAAEKAERMHAEARFLVQQQMKQLKEELTREAIESAVAAAERILRERISPADQQRLADEYLVSLKGRVAAQKGAHS
jgi:F-type H+-transporting ATPase subunit b